MKLPHQDPIRFAKNVITFEDEVALVNCEFPTIPSLAMFIEAAAQSSCVFGTSKTPLMGFLTTCKDIKLHSSPTSQSCIINIKEHFNSPSFGEYCFEALTNEKLLLASGSIVVFHPQN